MNEYDSEADEMAAMLKDVYLHFAAAQGEIPPVHKGRVAKFFTQKGSREYHYADLSDVIAAVRKPLADHQLSFQQSVEGEELATYIRHAGGGWLRSAIPFKVDPEWGPQEFGSALTYARRYGLCTALGIAAEEDDDGAKASGNTEDRMSKTAAQREEDWPNRDQDVQTLAAEVYRAFGPGPRAHVLSVVSRVLAEDRGGKPVPIKKATDLTKDEVAIARTLIKRKPDFKLGPVPNEDLQREMQRRVAVAALDPPPGIKVGTSLQDGYAITHEGLLKIINRKEAALVATLSIDECQLILEALTTQST